MSNIDKLITKFKELKEELSKNVNMSYSSQPNATTGTSGGQGGMYRSEKISADKNGQWKLDKVDPDENVNIPHPKKKAKMADGVNKDEKCAY